MVRRYALARSLLDIPTPRSSHTKPTPRGAGLAISVVIVAALLGLALDRRIPTDIAMAFAGGIMVAAIGWLDDRSEVPAWSRACVHLAAAFWALYWLGGFPALQFGPAVVQLGGVGTLVAGLGIAWWVNLYNFMDGTDALAGVQGVCAGVMGAALLAMDAQYGLSILSLVVAAACAGFLAWNWPPAKIFMGDVGSGLLGYMFGVLAVASELQGASPALLWWILLALFVADATYTLINRLFGAEIWYAAHRSHAYQRLVERGLSHKQVAVAAGALNVVVLWPVAYVAHLDRDLSPAAAGCIYVLLWFLWISIQRVCTLRPP